MLRLLIALTIVTTATTSAYADIAAAYEDILSHTAALAQSICSDVPEAGLTRDSIRGRVEANAGIIAKLITGDENISASRSQEIYNGIPFDKLPDKIPTASGSKRSFLPTYNPNSLRF
jgi:hypothetical protein